MARVVILSFDDNDAAEAFIEKTLDAQEDRYEGIPMAISSIVVAHATIEALVARPTVSCRCNIVGKSNRSANGRNKFNALHEHWHRTDKFGWYIHERCKRPNFFVVRDFIKNMLVSSGNNLLPALKEKRDAEVVAPERPSEPLAVGEVQVPIVEEQGSVRARDNLSEAPQA